MKMSLLQYQKKRLSKQILLDLYKSLLLPRMIEEKMLVLLRQGKLSKWFAGIGQEAISVGITKALEQDELLFTLHRNLGVFTSRNIPLHRLFAQWEGREAGFTKGRDRSFHFGTAEYGIVGMISHLGPQLSLAAGVALAHRLSQEKKISVAFTGEGGTSEGEFHEALNTAAVWKLPVLFVIENNGYGLSTPSSEQYACKHLVDRALGYGMEGHRIDGNNILEVYQTVKKLRDSMLNDPRPILLECETFRMRGHEEASGTKYVPKELMDAWAERDPLSNYESYLLGEGIISQEEIDALRKENKAHIQAELELAWQSPKVVANTERELGDVYAPYQQELQAPGSESKELRFVDAIKEGLEEAMDKHPKLVLMGQDIAEYGGVFKITDGFVERFGLERVRNTTLCESAIVGIGLGLSLKGYKAMVEMQFADFVSCGFNQIVNNLAKLHYRWGQNADVVVRMPCGAGTGAGPFHSQSNEAWFTHTPGLKVLYPATPEDAKGMLLAAFEDPNPILFFEHKALYRSVRSQVPEGYYTVELGKARLARKGQQASIITYGMGVYWAEEAVAELGLDVEIIDLRCLVPLDFEAIRQSIAKTNRALVLYEANRTSGFGADIAASIAEDCFELLDAPVMRVASLDTPIPFSQNLEADFLPKARLRQKLQELLDY